MKGDPRFSFRQDETPDEQHDRELTQARNDIRSLRYRIDALERAARSAVMLRKPYAPDRKQR